MMILACNLLGSGNMLIMLPYAHLYFCAFLFHRLIDFTIPIHIDNLAIDYPLLFDFINKTLGDCSLEVMVIIYSEFINYLLCLLIF